jgi:hypothetical protein
MESAYAIITLAVYSDNNILRPEPAFRCRGIRIDLLDQKPGVMRNNGDSDSADLVSVEIVVVFLLREVF